MSRTPVDATGGRRCLLFDVGNVLVDFDHRVVSRRLVQYGPDAAPARATAIHDFIFGDSSPASLNAQVDRGTLSLRSLHQTVSARFALAVSFETFRDVWSSIFAADLNHVVADRFGRFAAFGLDLWICSNTNEAHWSFLCSTFPVFGTLDRRGHCLLSFRIGQVKTDPGFFAGVGSRTGCRPARHLLIDDRDDNCRAAESAGLLALHFRRDGSPPEADAIDAFLLERGWIPST